MVLCDIILGVHLDPDVVSPLRLLTVLVGALSSGLRGYDFSRTGDGAKDSREPSDGVQASMAQAV